MKKKMAIMLGLLMVMPMLITIPTAQAADEFEIVIPWGLDHERGQIIASMIGNSTIGADYDFVYTQVGGGPSDRDALTARFLAGDYPDLILATLDWYVEFSQFGIFHDFAPEIGAWSNGRAGWQADIPTGFWSILDQDNGDGSGNGVYALPFFGQSILPYVNNEDLDEAGHNATYIAENGWTMAEFETVMQDLEDIGKTPFAMVGTQSSDLAYMNYMMASTDNFISNNRDPATVLAYGGSGEYGVNGTYSVDGFTTYMKMKGEGWVQSTVDTDGGGEANALFTAGNASMVFCGPWGTSIFEGSGPTNFTAVPMPSILGDGPSTIIGGGISLVPELPGLTNSTKVADAVKLAQELLEDDNQMKTVENWLGTAWRIPVRTSVTNDPWFSAYTNRSNFLQHVASLDYAYAWGKQHPDWMTVHEAVMMPGYYEALLDVDFNTTGQDYAALAQAALDEMAATIQFDYLIVQAPTTVVETVIENQTVIETVIENQTVIETVYETVTETVAVYTTVDNIVTSIVRVSGFSVVLLLAAVVPFIVYRKRR